MYKDEIINFPKILYKYRDWNNNIHRRIVTEREVYFASPKTFNDFLDCNLQPSYSPLTKPILRKIFSMHFYKQFPNGTKEEENIFVNYWMKYSPLVDKVKREKIRWSYREEFHARSGVLSVTDSYSNFELWKKYAADSTGFCVGFDASFFIGSGFQCSGGRVMYYDHLPRICPITLPHENGNPTSKWITEIYSKKQKWSFEKEFRLHSFQFQGINDEKRKVVLPPEAFKAIYLGSKMDQKSRKDLINVIELFIPNAQIIDMK